MVARRRGAARGLGEVVQGRVRPAPPAVCSAPPRNTTASHRDLWH